MAVDAAATNRPTGGKVQGPWLGRVVIDGAAVRGAVMEGAVIDGSVGQPTGQATVLELHPRLSVVAASPGEEQRLATLLRTAVTGSRAGIHAEFVAADGRELVVFRPQRGRARVVEIETGRELTDAVTPEMWGFGSNAAPGSKLSDLIVLAQLDQVTIWPLADSVIAARQPTKTRVGAGAHAAPQRRGWGRRRQPHVTTPGLSAVARNLAALMHDDPPSQGRRILTGRPRRLAAAPNGRSKLANPAHPRPNAMAR